jgi:hypothetical protein
MRLLRLALRNRAALGVLGILGALVAAYFAGRRQAHARREADALLVKALRAKERAKADEANATLRREWTVAATDAAIALAELDDATAAREAIEARIAGTVTQPQEDRALPPGERVSRIKQRERELGLRP